VQETRGFDGETGVSVSQRSKEMAHDYRYFPDPDLMPVVVDEAWKARLQAECPELPFDRQRRYFEQFALPYTVTSVLVPDRALCDYFEETAKGVKKPLDAANWIANDLLKELAAAGVGIANSRVRPAQLAALIGLVDEGALSVGLAREVLAEMFKTGEEPAAIVERKGLRQSTDTGELETWARAAIAANPAAVADFKAGKENAINSLKGVVMKQSKGKANPRVVDEIMRRILGEI
jgi:aspartyl-tRNA(Asn)/glutamyl-tRNA(Gln) amidotransferase subunit B